MNEEIPPVKILIADDHQMFIDGVKLSLRKETRYQVVAEALHGKKAFEIIQNQPINLLITDIRMPEMTGTELTKEVKLHFPDIKVLVITSYNEVEIVREIIESGAEGYLLKNAGKHELLLALKKITEGGLYYSDEITAILLRNIQTTTKQEDNVKSLTPRELEIIKLICREFSSVEIAKELNISPLTVETHRKHIYEKTNSKTVVGLIKFAIKNNLV